MQYTLKQCYQLLGVNNRQFDRLLADASISKQMLVTPSNDHRVRLVSEEQLAQLRTVQLAQRLPTHEPDGAQACIAALEAENAALKRRIAVLELAQKHAYAPVTRYDDREMASPPLDVESISHSPSKPPVRQRSASIYAPADGGVKRNADGEYRFGDDGLSYDEQGLLTDRAFARIAADHGAKFETARQSWARSIPDSMRGSRNLAVQWMLTSRRAYLTAQCSVADCPCQEAPQNDA